MIPLDHKERVMFLNLITMAVDFEFPSYLIASPVIGKHAAVSNKYLWVKQNYIRTDLLSQHLYRRRPWPLKRYININTFLDV